MYFFNKQENDNEVYYGNWKQGKTHGKGIFTWSNGVKFKGYFNNDLIKGFGTLSFPETNGDTRIKFEGEWKETFNL